MKKAVLFLSACTMAVALTACSGPNYMMRTSDGRTIISEGKPVTDSETGMIRYVDADGNKQQINRTDIREMVALD
ncbi:YgdI/YgdR family lipoprotein [Erwinia sp. CPCC 100877]|nr:YgdI/YgdR family lipoprotein [Erwinia sp. CPCC 100877]